MELFDAADRSRRSREAPLAERMRPRSLDEMVGLEALLNPTEPLGRLFAGDRLVSLILWGPPGSGKTTLARLLAKRRGVAFEPLSAVAAGIKELREVFARARERATMDQVRTVLFIDEIHRFHKGQQDALLPSVEDGTVILFGATTENPAFELNRPLLSRCRLCTLPGLDEAGLRRILERALRDDERGLGNLGLILEGGAIDLIAQLAGRDARFALNLLEAGAIAASAAGATPPRLDRALLAAIAQRPPAAYDRSGEEHFNSLSALHKSLRGSDPDAALYWIARMLEGGEDPLVIARRMVRVASEDIGLADPNALRRALAGMEAARFLGRPEGDLALAQVAVDLALAPKSDALDAAFQRALADARELGPAPVPLHLRNVQTGLDAAAREAHRYRSPHTAEHAVVAQDYLPAAVLSKSEHLPYYRPGPRGGEPRLAARRAELAQHLEEAAAKEPLSPAPHPDRRGSPKEEDS